MIALDTNVLVRLLTGDDARAQRAAAALIEMRASAAEPAFVSQIVVVELFWVLRRLYRYSREDIANALERFLSAGSFAFEGREAVRFALQAYRDGADFADALIGERAKAAGCPAVYTFDARAVSQLSAFVPITYA